MEIESGCIISSMATAIVRVFNGDAFIIAADGRETELPSGKVLCDVRQKIFQVGSYPVAYCMIGKTLLGDDRSLDLKILFNFNTEVRERLTASALEQHESLEGAVREVAGRVYASLCETSANVPLSFGVTSQYVSLPVVTLFVDGFWKRGAERIRVSFSRIGKDLVEPKPYSQSCDGLQLHLDPLVKEGEECFKDQRGLASLVNGAERYVQACIDSENWPGIGGRLHAVTITREAGFQWVPGREPLKI